MTTLIAGTQVFLGGGVLLLAIVVLLWAVIAGIDKIFDRHFEAGKQHQFRVDADRLMGNSWWFSEDKTTQELIADLSRDGVSVSDARDKWCHSRKGGAP
jgi:hypothetical protein